MEITNIDVESKEHLTSNKKSHLFNIINFVSRTNGAETDEACIMALRFEILLNTETFPNYFLK